MFRDKEEELARLEELLEEAEEEISQEEEEPSFLEEPSGDTNVYHNFANDYGKVDAYNADITDVDLEEFAEDVCAPEKEKYTGLLITAAALFGGIVLVLIWWLLRYLGVV